MRDEREELFKMLESGVTALHLEATMAFNMLEGGVTRLHLEATVSAIPTPRDFGQSLGCLV